MTRRTIYSTGPILPTFDADVLKQAIAGRTVVVWNHGRLPMRLRFEDERYYEHAKKVGYLVKRPGKRSLEWLWRYWCHEQHIPVIQLRLASVYAAITVDATMRPYGLSDETYRTVRQLLEELTINRRYVRGDWSYIEGRFIPRAEAYGLAARLVSLTRQG